MLEIDHNLRRKKAVHSILLNKLFKNSWIGQHIVSLSHYKQKLIESLKEDEINLEDY